MLELKAEVVLKFHKNWFSVDVIVSSVLIYQYNFCCFFAKGQNSAAKENNDHVVLVL